jgi:DNA repair protein RecO (recombination protein O)
VASRDTLLPAFVLHRRAYSNHSLLIEFFTPAEGRFPAIAKGIKKARGHGSSLLQPFTPVLIRCSGRGEVKSLIDLEPAPAAAVPLRGRALYCGFYLNELLMRLLQRDDPHERLFEVYAHTLGQLSEGERLEHTLRRFEIRLLEELGFGLVLDREAETGAPLEPDRLYHYSIEQGPMPAQDGSLRGSTLLALNRGQALDKQGDRQARGLTRRVLTHYLGDRPLKSRELFRSLLPRGEG